MKKQRQKYRGSEEVRQESEQESRDIGNGAVEAGACLCEIIF